ncbi:MAG TPA: hypothetical protein PK765_00500 [bacterium]|mgnify:CR=1 FL=1|nr:hypothetical protein [bacterium]
MKDVHFSGGTAKSDIVSWLKTGDISQVQGALAALDSSLGGHVGGDGADWASVSSAKDAWKAL